MALGRDYGLHLLDNPLGESISLLAEEKAGMKWPRSLPITR